MMLIMSRSPGQLTGFLSAFLTFLSSPLPSEVGGRLAKAALQPSPTTHQPATHGLSTSVASVPCGSHPGHCPGGHSGSCHPPPPRHLVPMVKL